MYIASALQIGVFYAVIQNHYEKVSSRISMLILYTIAIILKIVLTGIVSYIDPSDRLMMEVKKTDSPEKSARIAKLK